MDWGNGSEVIAAVSGGLSAIGSFFASVLTGYLAVRERKRAERIEAQAADLEMVRRHALIDEAKVIGKQIYDLLDGFSGKPHPVGISWWSTYDDYKAAVDIECDRLLDLQSFANVDVRLYTTLSRMARASRLPKRLPDTGESQVMLTAIRSLKLVRKLIAEIETYR
jgi:hypothetical protein